MKAIRDLGLLDNRPIKVKGETVVPRAAFIAAVSPKLTRPEAHDLVALRVVVTGTNGKRAAWELLDYYDTETGISAMMRTTGYSLSITGLMQVDGRISKHGVLTPDQAVPFGAYVNELAHRGVRIQEA
jgi:lysine 6-dehydrogenase